jgi:Tol biopolymer transport system component
MIEGRLARLPIRLLALVGAILVLLIAMGRHPAGPSPAAASHGGPWHVVQLVSVASDGTQGNSHSVSPSISADGRYVAFSSLASNLVPGDTNGKQDIFVHDRLTGQTTRVSVASDGTQGNGDSDFASISADGRYVAFSSLASNLVAGDTNGTWDVFVHDRLTGQTTRVSVASDGTQGNEDSIGVEISADGRYVAFTSLASNLVAGDTNGTWDVFVHDRLTGQTTRVSVASDGTEGNGHSLYGLSISADGRYVAFASVASNLVSGDANGGITDAFIAAAVEPTAIRLLWGDVNCSGDVEAVDALQILRHLVRLPVLQQEPCPDIGVTASVNGTPRLWGDVDGDGEVNAADALKILRHVAMMSVEQQPGTPPIGREVEVRP